MPDNHSDFWRLTAGLRAAVVAFDYYQTRKLLEPNWDGYDMPQGHDLIHPDVDVVDANIVTSQHRDNPDLHRIVLDLDYGVTQEPNFFGGSRLTLTSHLSVGVLSRSPATRFVEVALSPHAHVHMEREKLRISPGPDCDFALIPSSTPGHHHLILDVNLPSEKYFRLLANLSIVGIVQTGYATASKKRGFSAIRPPWIRKTDTPASVNASAPPTAYSDQLAGCSARQFHSGAAPTRITTDSHQCQGAARTRENTMRRHDGNHTGSLEGY